MKLFDIDGHIELHIDEPFVEGPELVSGHGKSVRGYIKFRNGDNSITSSDECPDTELCWPVWFGETQGMFKEGEKDAYYWGSISGKQ